MAKTVSTSSISDVTATACGAWDRCDVTPLIAARYLIAMITVLALNACGSPYYTSDSIEAWVVDADTGQPIEGAVVTANWQLVGFGFDTGGRKLGQLEVMETLTDKNGRFYFPGFTKLNPGLDDLREEDPQILIFKPGYSYMRAANDYPIGKEASQGTHRKSSINGQRVKMKKANPDVKKYAFELGFLTMNLDHIGYSGNLSSIPKMIHALACERRRLIAIEPSIGPISVSGSSGYEKCAD